MSLRALVDPPGTRDGKYVSENEEPRISQPRVVVIDIDMPMGRMVLFALKASVAAIPVYLMWLMLAAAVSGITRVAAG